MNEQIQQALDLPAVDQIGFVVRDLDAAMAQYSPLFGAFTTMDASDMVWQYYGEPEKSSIKIALAKHGDVEIELIEWVAGKTPHKDFLDEAGEGMQHLRFVVDNCDEMIEKAAAFGYQTAWYNKFAEGLVAAYMKRDSDPLYIEFFENRL